MARTATTAIPHPRTPGHPPAAVLRGVTLATPFYELILDSVSIDLPRGQVSTVLSHHDANASTVLDLLDGRTRPTWGSVQVAGREVTRLGHGELSRLKEEHIARVRPMYGMLPQLSIQQNLVVAQRHADRATDLALVDRVAGLLGLHGTLGEHTSAAERAVRARWAVARSLVTRPTLVLGEDVTAGLTRTDELDLLDALGDAARVLGVGVVLATRDAITASATERALLLHRSRLYDVTGEL